MGIAHHHRIVRKPPLVLGRDILLLFHGRHIPLPKGPVPANSGIQIENFHALGFRYTALGTP